jgi:hypothetical protein
MGFTITGRGVAEEGAGVTAIGPGVVAAGVEAVAHAGTTTGVTAGVTAQPAIEAKAMPAATVMTDFTLRSPGRWAGLVSLATQC